MRHVPDVPVSPSFLLARPLAGPALAETLDGGQCFRWKRRADGTWNGVSGPLAVELMECASEGPNSPVQAAGFSIRLRAGTTADLRHHLADDLDWHALADSLPWRSDPHLATCLAAFPGLRILRQPIGETLLCFLCSATKQIVQIKQMVDLLATRFGPILPGTLEARGRGGSRHLSDDPVSGDPLLHGLPDWRALERVPEKALRECLLGFRAKHVAGVAAYLAERPGWLEETASLPYQEARARLMELPGVGGKIADCVLLFGAGKLEAFPVDVWILRVMERRYGLHGWSPAQVAHFGRTHFGPLAGLAQQYLFAWERQAAG